MSGAGAGSPTTLHNTLASLGVPVDPAIAYIFAKIVCNFRKLLRAID